MNKLFCSILLISLSLNAVTIDKFIRTIRANDVGLVKRQLNENPSLLTQSTAGPMAFGSPPDIITPLLTAARSAPAMLETIIAAYQKYFPAASLKNFVNTSGLDSPLHVAIMAKNSENIRILLNHGADVHQRNLEGATPLHTAVLGGSQEIIDVLLEHGAGEDLNTRAGTNMFESTPVGFAAINHNVPNVQYLLSRGGLPQTLIVNNVEQTVSEYGERELVSHRLTPSQRDSWHTILRLLEPYDNVRQAQMPPLSVRLKNEIEPDCILQ